MGFSFAQPMPQRQKKKKTFTQECFFSIAALGKVFRNMEQRGTWS